MLGLYQPWALERLGQAVFELGHAFTLEIVVPAMVLVESIPLVRPYSRHGHTCEEFLTQVVEELAFFRVEPFGFQHARLLPELEGVPELHDRMIASHAVALGAPLLTPDQELRQSGLVECVW